jgi:UPF0755 protein
VVTGPTEPRPGRHASPESGSGAGRPAAELLAAWAGTGTTAVDIAEPRIGSAVTGAPLDGPPGASRRRRAPETDPASPAPVTAGRAADDPPWPAAPARSSSRQAAPRTAAAPASGTLTPGAAAPRTAAMPAVAPRVPAARPQTGRPGVDAPPAGAPLADRFADAETAPGVSSGARRPRLGGRRAADRALAGTDIASTAGTAAGTAAGTQDADQPSGDLLMQERDEWSAGLPADLFDDVPPAADGRTATGPRSRHHVPQDEPDGAPAEHGDDHGDDGDHPVFDETGGLEVIVADVSASDADQHDDGFYDDADDADGADHSGGDGDGPGGGRGRRGRGGGGGGRDGRDGRPRKRRRPLAVVLSLAVLIALVAGVLVGGHALLRTINPAAEDYSGAGSGSVDIRISDGDSLRTIAGTLVGADVIASGTPFLDAAKAHPQATSIQPGVYRMQQQMSGAAALDLLLDPATRQLSRVTVPEGLTVAQTLQRVADTAGIPLPDLQAAAMDTAGLGLPPYANGLLEGFLFPATYDIEPGTAAVDVLKPMVARTVQALDALSIPVDQRLTVLTKASIVQSESGSVEDMGKVARVLENRLADGMPLQLDTTVNYANGKSGVTTSPDDRANPSPYNTYVHPGLPPGAISNPGEQALEAVLAPTPGDWRFFVVVDPHTGDTRFAVTGAEHQQNVLLFQQWLRDHPNG